MPDLPPIPSLEPQDAQGHQFVFYGDCCSGSAGQPREANFAAVNGAIRRLTPQPEFLCFIGDHIVGMTTDYDDLRRQWRYWLDHEMAWLDQQATPIYHVTSNHNTYDAPSEDIWREVFPQIPRNGPPGQEGLSYFVRRGDLLLVAANTSYSGLGGYGHVESRWLDQVLRANADAKRKLVLGHHPVFPVNGYDETPLWCIEPEQGQAFWRTLVEHDVLAYLCSHIIAFDVQAHEGVLQVTSGGAGTEYGPGGFMPGPVEYHHAVQASVDARGLRYQVLDVEGRARETLEWPLVVPPVSEWRDGAGEWEGQDGSRVSFFRLSGTAPRGDEQTLISGFSTPNEPAVVKIGLEGEPMRLTVHMTMGTDDTQRWDGPPLPPDQGFDLRLAIHRDMGPGGVLWREDEDSAWSSLSSSSARGAADVAWPARWVVGEDVADLRVKWR